MAAAIILENSDSNNYHIHLFEKNSSPWRKVIISGGGRCNLTTGIEDKKILLSKYTRGSDFIKKAMGKFPPHKVREWFESHGVPLKCEADNRVFPTSDDGRDIVDIFEDIFAKYRDNISIHHGEWVTEVSMNSENFIMKTSKWTYESDILVITTWGNAYSHTGSTGDGYIFSKNLGHTITKLWPSLSSFLTKESWMHACSGIAFENAKIVSWNLTINWPILITHFGISWPLTFVLSSELAWEQIDKNHPKSIYLSPISEMNFTIWNDFLKQQFQDHPKKLITSILSEKLPRRFVEWFVKEFASEMENTFVSSISRNDREKLAKLLSEWIPITLTERRPGDEFVTAGWVSTDEIDSETMESKIQKNLYFAGEVLNVDAVTWGFNLQSCWDSGYVAGKTIAWKIIQTN